MRWPCTARQQGQDVGKGSPRKGVNQLERRVREIADQWKNEMK